MPSVNQAGENGLNTPEPLRLTASSLLTRRRKRLSISCSTNLSAACIAHYAHLMYRPPDESDAEARVPLPPMDGSFQCETTGGVVITHLLLAVPHSQAYSVRFPVGGTDIRPMSVAHFLQQKKKVCSIDLFHSPRVSFRESLPLKDGK